MRLSISCKIFCRTPIFKYSWSLSTDWQKIIERHETLTIVWQKKNLYTTMTSYIILWTVTSAAYRPKTIVCPWVRCPRTGSMSPEVRKYFDERDLDGSYKSSKYRIERLECWSKKFFFFLKHAVKWMKGVWVYGEGWTRPGWRMKETANPVTKRRKVPTLLLLRMLSTSEIC